MELALIQKGKVVQVFRNDAPVKLEGVGLITNPSVLSVEKWGELNCYPVLQPICNRYEEIGDVVWNSSTKKASRPAIEMPIDIDEEKALLKEKYRSDAERKHAELNAQDWKDLRTLGAVSDEQKAKHEAITEEYRQQCAGIDEATSLFDLLKY